MVPRRGTELKRVRHDGFEARFEFHKRLTFSRFFVYLFTIRSLSSRSASEFRNDSSIGVDPATYIIMRSLVGNIYKRAVRMKNSTRHWGALPRARARASSLRQKNAVALCRVMKRSSVLRTRRSAISDRPF